MYPRVTQAASVPAYTLKRNARSRSLRILIRGDGNIVVTAPLFLSVRKIEAYLQEKKSWILERQQALREQYEKILEQQKKYRAEYLEYKEAARRLALRRIIELNEIYGFSYKNISIKNQKTRWGSCSRRGNLNFHYRVLFLPPALADYLIVHELCHLAEMNHSKKFWALVEKTVPNYKEMRKVLKRGLF